MSAWATAHVDWPGEVGYTARRLLGAEESIQKLLAPVGRPEFGLALDIGSGAGYNTFALAEASSAVIGIDQRWRSVLLGRYIARITDTDRVRFSRGDAATFDPGPVADLVLSNLMSHGAGDRDTLLRALRNCSRLGGSLIYSEETEGYPLMEMTRAVRERDRRSLRARADQLLTGLQGGVGFRFFHSGSAAPVLARVGWRVQRTEVRTWHGVPFIETNWAVAVDHANGAERREEGRQPDRGIARLGLPLAHAAVPGGVKSAWRERLRLSVDHLRAPDWDKLDVLASGLEARLAERLRLDLDARQSR